MNYAVQAGLESMSQYNPKFCGAEELLLRHIDWKKLRKKADDIYSGLLQNKIHGERAMGYIEKELAEYFESGGFFDKIGSKIVADRGIKEKTGFLEKIVSLFRPQSGKDKESVDTTDALLRDLYLFYMSKGYDSIPDLRENFQKAGEYLQKVGGRDVVGGEADIFEAYGRGKGKDSWRRYSQESRKSKKEGEEHIKNIESGIQKYVEGMAASILAIGGFIVLFFNLRFTGAVVGTYGNIGTSIVGISCIIIALVLFLRRKNI
jgi:hypothetical protein